MMTQLNQKRQKLCVSIRNAAKQQQAQKRRFQFIVNQCQEYERLRHIDCFECIKKIKSSNNYFEISKQFEEMFTYCASKEGPHLFSILDHKVIQKVIEIGMWTFRDRDFEVLKDTIDSIRYKVACILSGYFMYAPTEVLNHQLYEFLNSCLSSKSKLQINQEVMNIVEILLNASPTPSSFLHGKWLKSIITNYKNINMNDLVSFTKELFDVLSVFLFKSFPEIKTLIHILEYEITLATEDKQMGQIIDTMCKFFNSQIILDEQTIISNQHVLLMLCTWLLEKYNLQIAKPINKKILSIFKILFRHQHNSDQFIEILTSIIINYFEPMSKKITYCKFDFQFSFFQVMSDACANCHLVKIIVEQKQIMQALLHEDFGHSTNTKNMVIEAVCNLVLSSDTQQLGDHVYDILYLITDNISSCENKNVVKLILMALVQLFQFGQSQVESGRFKQNVVLEKFRSRSGIQHLEELGSCLNTKSINKLIENLYNLMLDSLSVDSEDLP